MKISITQDEKYEKNKEPSLTRYFWKQHDKRKSMPYMELLEVRQILILLLGQNSNQRTLRHLLEKFDIEIYDRDNKTEMEGREEEGK